MHLRASLFHFPLLQRETQSPRFATAVTVCSPTHPPREEVTSGGTGRWGRWTVFTRISPGAVKRRKWSGTDMNVSQYEAAKVNDDGREPETKTGRNEREQLQVSYLIGHDSLLGGVSSSPLLGTTGDTLDDINADIPQYSNQTTCPFISYLSTTKDEFHRLLLR